MKIWLVGILDCEATDVQHACLSKRTALKRWNEIRLELIKDYKTTLKSMIAKKFYNNEINLYKRLLTNLKETNPTKLENYPHEEPFIMEMECEP